MKVLFIEGGGEGGYQADQALVTSLQGHLGAKYEVLYPQLQSDESAPDFGWLRQIGQNILAIKGPLVIVAHSLGGSMLLKYLSENAVPENVKGVFLMSTPFWSGDEEWKSGLKLRDDFAAQLPRKVPLYFYHCTDDDVAPIAHFNVYRQKIARATFREIGSGGHQLNNDLTVVAKDIRSLMV